MQTTQRRIDPGVINQLLDEPQKFEFFQLVRVLEIWFGMQISDSAHTTNTVRPRGLFARRIGFRNTLSLSFPRARSHRRRYTTLPGRSCKTALSKSGRCRATASSGWSLLSRSSACWAAKGALPLHYTEQIVAHEQATRDHSARAFLDALGNRAAALFYAAWKKSRLLFHHELDRNDRYLPTLLSLAGVSDRDAREKACGPDRAD